MSRRLSDSVFACWQNSDLEDIHEESETSTPSSSPPNQSPLADVRVRINVASGEDQRTNDSRRSPGLPNYSYKKPGNNTSKSTTGSKQNQIKMVDKATNTIPTTDPIKKVVRSMSTQTEDELFERPMSEQEMFHTEMNCSF